MKKNIKVKYLSWQSEFYTKRRNLLQQVGQTGPHVFFFKVQGQIFRFMNENLNENLQRNCEVWPFKG